MLKSACSVQWLTCVRSKAVGVRFAVLVLRMLFESRLLGGALERLEADLALDCLSGGILSITSAFVGAALLSEIIIPPSADSLLLSCRRPCDRAFAVPLLRCPCCLSCPNCDFGIRLE